MYKATTNYSALTRIDLSASTPGYYGYDYPLFKTFFGTGDKPPDLVLFTPPPQIKLIPGIVYGEQHLGLGQDLAMRLYDSSTNTLIGLKVSELKDRVQLYIDNDNNVMVKCLPQSTAPSSGISSSGISLEGLPIWTFIFNIFDASGWLLKAETDVSLNLINETLINNILTNETQYGVSFEGINQILRVRENASSTEFADISNEYISNTEANDLSYSIYIEGKNELKIKTKNANVSYNGWYLDSLKFHLYDIDVGTFLNPDNPYVHIAPATGYDISYDSIIADDCFNLSIINSGEISNNHLIKLDPLGHTIGVIYPYGYSIHGQTDLGGYYNINNLTFNSSNLIKLNSDNGVKLGTLTF
jgi:hypothetical protein